MAKLSYTKLQSASRGRYDLMVDAKVKELIDWYEISMLLTFAAEWEEWKAGISDTNAFRFANAFRFNIKNGVGQIWKHFMGSDKDPVLVYEIREVEDQPIEETASPDSRDRSDASDKRKEVSNG